MDLKNINNVLAFIILLLGVAITFIPSEKYETIINNIGVAIIIIGIATLVISNCNIKKDKKERKEIASKFEALDYETQKQRLITKGIPEHYISGLGKNPLFKQAYQSGQEYEKKGNYKDAIKSYKEILNYSLVDEENKVAAYNLIGLSHFKLFELEEAMKIFEMAINIVKKVKVKEDRLTGEAVTLTNIGHIYKELGQWKNTIKNYKSALGIHLKLHNKLEQANSLYNIYLIYLYLNNPKKALKKVKEAIKAYQEALKVYTLKKFPLDYAETQNNLGVAYSNLALFENRAFNCNLAIKAYQ